MYFTDFYFSGGRGLAHDFTITSAPPPSHPTLLQKRINLNFPFFFGPKCIITSILKYLSVFHVLDTIYALAECLRLSLSLKSFCTVRWGEIE